MEQKVDVGQCCHLDLNRLCFIFSTERLDNFKNYDSTLDRFMMKRYYSYDEIIDSLLRHELYFKEKDIDILKVLLTQIVSDFNKLINRLPVNTKISWHDDTYYYFFPLLCLLSVFDAPEHKEKKNLIQSILAPVVDKLSDNLFYEIYTQYINYTGLRKLKVTLWELDIIKSNPSLELIQKLCVCENLLQYGLHEAHEEFLNKHWRYFFTKFEDVNFERYRNETAHMFFSVLLHTHNLLLKSPLEHEKIISELYKKFLIILSKLSLRKIWTWMKDCKNYQILTNFLEKFSAVYNSCRLGINEPEEPHISNKFLLLLEIILIYKEENELMNCLERFCEIDNTDDVESLIAEWAFQVCSEKYCTTNDCIILAKLLLDINVSHPKNSLLSYLTDTLEGHLTKKIKYEEVFVGKRTHPSLCYCYKIVLRAIRKRQMPDMIIPDYRKHIDLATDTEEHVAEIQKKAGVSEQLVLFMLLLITSSMGHHKSAKLKKYLTLKYEYDGAILYLLWCSGDVERNPGPPFKKRQLWHASERERKWMHDISAVLLKCYHGELPKSKPKKLWSKKPDHWPPSMPFYDTKNKSQDESRQVISNEDLLKCLLECCHKKGIQIQQSYQQEIKAWHSNKLQLLYKLYIFRTESENIYGILQNLLPFIDDNDLKQNLKDVKVTLNTENRIKQIKNPRSKGQTELFADITRNLAGALCRIVKGKDPEEKCDGIWKEAPEGWPKDVPFFSPYNRAKSDQKCSDHKLVATLLQNSKAIIPAKYKSLVDAYKDVMKAGDKKKAKKQKETLCKLYVIQTNISKLDYVLKRLQEEGLFLSEVNKILDQWWLSETVDKDAEEKLSQTQCNSEIRPDISINISLNLIKLFVNLDSKSNEVISYCIPVNHSKTPSGSTSIKTLNQKGITLQIDQTSNDNTSYRSHSLFTCNDDQQDRTSINTPMTKSINSSSVICNLTTPILTSGQLQGRDTPCFASPICNNKRLENNDTLTATNQGQSHVVEADTTYNCLDNVPGTSRRIDVGSSPFLSDDQTKHSHRCSTIQSNTRKRNYSNDQDSTDHEQTVTRKNKARNIEGLENVPSLSGHSTSIPQPIDLDTQLINLAIELNLSYLASKLPTDMTEIPQPTELDIKFLSDNLLVSSDDSDLPTLMTDTDYCLQSDDEEESGTKLENLLTDIINFNSGKDSEMERLLDDEL